MTWHLQHVSVADGELRALWYRHLGLDTEAVGNSTGQRKTVTRHETWKHGTHQQSVQYEGSDYEGVCAFLSPSVYYLLHSWQSADLTARVPLPVSSCRSLLPRNLKTITHCCCCPQSEPPSAAYLHIDNATQTKVMIDSDLDASFLY